MIDARLFCKECAPTNKASLPVHPKAAVLGNPTLWWPIPQIVAPIGAIGKLRTAV